MKLSKSVAINKVLFLLVVEFIALISFSLGGISPFFQYISVILLALMILFVPFDLKKEERTRFLVVLGVILILAGSIAFGNLNKDQNIMQKIGYFLVVPSFFVLGVYARWIKVFDLDYVLYAIGGGLALLVTISMIYTWSQYGLFYAEIYKNTPSYYYNGELFNVTKEMGWLSGFSFKTVYINYGATYSFMLACYLPMLLFISPKKELRKFIIIAVLGSIGLLSILTIPFWEALLMLIPVFIFAGYHKFMGTNIFKEDTKKKIKKVLSISYVVLAGLALVYFFADILIISVFEPNYGVLENIPLLHKIFYNGRIMAPINNLIATTLNTRFLFGIYPDKTMSISIELLSQESRFFISEGIKEGGILALFGGILLTVLSVRLCSYYFKKSGDEKYQKIGLLAVLLGFVFYHLRYTISIPFVHEDILLTIFRTPPFMIVIFILGLVCVPRVIQKEEKPAVENKTDDKEIVDDYNFTMDEEEVKHE